MDIFCNSNDFPLGVFSSGKGKNKSIQINYATDKENSGVILYKRGSDVEIGRFAFEENSSDAYIHQLTIPQYSLDEVSYLFYEEGKPVIDRKAVAFDGADQFGTSKAINKFRAMIPDMTYDWENDLLPKHLPQNSVAYCLHVRGFTMHESSNVNAKGTFAGIIEKIPYLKELGVTTIELQPAYEFVEYPLNYSQKEGSEQSGNVKLNYWGYTEGFYYTPKRAYTFGENPVIEFKDMVKTLHQNGMELIMQFYFPVSFPVTEISSVLKFWHREYHVDGFHLKGSELPATSLATDPYLYNAKLMHEAFEEEKLVHVSKKRGQRFFLYNDEYKNMLRSFLKSDYGTLLPAMRKMFERNLPGNISVINYLSNYDGFTMNDMVCYQEKHNEANGEENRDGTDYNLTWNCGAEGICHKIEIQVLRERQLRNAFALLFLSQGVPLIFMGDEFGNSQLGNNNPYCQDNEITWLDWSLLKNHEGLHAYVKQLIDIRKHNAAFYMSEELLNNRNNGFPGISYHGAQAWKLSLDENSLHIGILLNGSSNKEDTANFWYIAINMHWEDQVLALPRVKGDRPWECVFSTEGVLKKWVDTHQMIIGGRSISLFCVRK